MGTKNNNYLISVIIPAYNEAKVIEKNLKALKKQSYKNLEIIIVDDGSTDETVSISKRYTGKVFERSHEERSVQRNFGALKASGKSLLFLDADMELSRNVVKECLNLMLKDKNVGAIAIPEKSVAETFWEKVKGFERSFYNDYGDDYTDAARFFTRKAYDEVGGYDETITGPEDWDLPDRIKSFGYKIGRVKSFIYHHERVLNPFKVARKKFYYGLRSYRYFEKNKISALGPKTIYFLRPAFYKNWKKMVDHPVLTIAMFFMLTLEQIGGGLGYLIGKYKKM